MVPYPSEGNERVRTFQINAAFGVEKVTLSKVRFLAVSALLFAHAWFLELANASQVENSKESGKPAVEEYLPVPDSTPSYLIDESDLPAGPTEAEIPKNAPAEIKAALSDTYSPDAIKRAAAARVLGRTPSQAVVTVPFLIRLLHDHAGVGYKAYKEFPIEITVGSEAFGALVDLGEPAVEPCLMGLKTYAGTKRGAPLIRILADLKDDRITDLFLKLATNPDPLVRNEVVRSQLGVDNARLLPALLRALKDDNQAVRSSAAWVLQGKNEPRCIPPLIEALSDNDPGVRRYVVRALGDYKEEQVEVVLKRLALDETEDPGLRSLATQQLGRIGGPGSFELLVRVLRDRNVDQIVRAGAARGLSGIKDVRAVEAMTATARARNEPKELRCHVIETLSTSEGKGCIPLLSEIAKSVGDDATVKCHAAVQVVELKSGHIADIEIVSALRGNYAIERSYTALGEAVKTRRKSLQLVAEHGTTDLVRRAASSLLDESKG